MELAAPCSDPASLKPSCAQGDRRRCVRCATLGQRFNQCILGELAALVVLIRGAPAGPATPESQVPKFWNRVNQQMHPLALSQPDLDDRTPG